MTQATNSLSNLSKYSYHVDVTFDFYTLLLFLTVEGITALAPVTWYDVHYKASHKYRRYLAKVLPLSKSKGRREVVDNDQRLFHLDRIRREADKKVPRFKAGEDTNCLQKPVPCNGPLEPGVEYRFVRYMFSTERHKRGRQNGPFCLTSNLNHDGLAANGFSGIFMPRRLLASLSEVSFNSTKPTKMIAELENSFWEDCKTLLLHKVIKGLL